MAILRWKVRVQGQAVIEAEDLEGASVKLTVLRDQLLQAMHVSSLRMYPQIDSPKVVGPVTKLGEGL